MKYGGDVGALVGDGTVQLEVGIGVGNLGNGMSQSGINVGFLYGPICLDINL